MFVRNLIRKILGRKSGVELARSLGVKVGERCKFIGVNKNSFGSEPYLIKIGDHVELSGNVRFLPHDGSVWVFRDEDPEIDIMMPIEIGNNVFIGNSSIILCGAKIGNDCVIGAGSVVRGDIPSGSVAAGVPAKVIRRINEYRGKIDPLLLKTKKMSAVEKKKYLRAHFGIND